MKIALALLSALLLAAGCAGSPSSSPSSFPPSSSPPVSSAPVPSAPAPSVPDPSVPADPSPTKPDGAGQATLTGTVTAGVEPGCLLLNNHLLIFEDESLRSQAAVGTEVVATGRVQADVMSTCQQGIPFLVTALRPA